MNMSAINSIKAAEKVRKLKIANGSQFRLKGVSFTVETVPMVGPESFTLTTNNSRLSEYEAMEIMHGPKKVRYSDFVHHLRCTHDALGSPVINGKKHLIDILINGNYHIG
jgi:hypothetical protein